MSIAVETVIEVYGPMERNAQNRAKIAAGEWNCPLRSQRAVGRWSSAGGAIVKLSIICIPRDVESRCVADRDRVLLDSEVGIHFDFVDVAVVIRHFDANASDLERTASARNVKAVTEIRVEVGGVVGSIVYCPDCDPAAFRIRAARLGCGSTR